MGACSRARRGGRGEERRGSGDLCEGGWLATVKRVVWVRERKRLTPIHC